MRRRPDRAAGASSAPPPPRNGPNYDATAASSLCSRWFSFCSPARSHSAPRSIRASIASATQPPRPTAPCGCRFLLLLAAILAYGLLWALLAAVVDGFGRSSAFNALTLIGAWAAVTLLAPAAIDTLADTLYPAPSRAEMALAAQAATTDANREQDAALARYAQEHPGQKAAEMTPGDRREQTLRRLAVLEAANARVEAVLQRHDARLAEQHALADRPSFLSPALLMYRTTADLAGTGDRRQAEFSARLDAFHASWRAFFASRIRAGAPLTLADYGALPLFSDAHDDAVVAAEATPALSLGLGVPVLLLGVLALRGLRRCKPS